jgi:hypothetical protein
MTVSAERGDALKTIWQIGIVVAEIDAASAELAQALGLKSPGAAERAFGDHPLRVSIAKQGPLLL